VSDAIEVLKLVEVAVEALRDCFARHDYGTVSKIWDDVWFDLRFISNEELASAREQFGVEIGSLIETTRKQMKHKRVRGDIAPKLQSVAAKVGSSK